MVRVLWASSGLPGRVPLPPLNGVLFVIASSPLLKSPYSLNALTLMCAQRAPRRASPT
jgi:hypothetical protein